MGERKAGTRHGTTHGGSKPAAELGTPIPLAQANPPASATPAREPPVLRLSVLAIFVVITPCIFSQLWRDVVIESFSQLWAIAGWTIFFLISIAVRIFNHHREQKPWGDLWTEVWSYIHSPGFCISAIAAFLVFLAAFAVVIPRKFGELEGIVRKEQKHSSEMAKRRYTTNWLESVDTRRLDETQRTLDSTRSELVSVSNKLNDTQIRLTQALRDGQTLREQVNAGEFVPLAKDREERFVKELREWFQKWPSFTNLPIIVDGTERPRRLWLENITRITDEAKLPVRYSGGNNMDRGIYDLVLFYRPGNERAAIELAVPLVNLFKRPITGHTNRSNDDYYPLSVRLMGDPFFYTNGVIYFK